MNAGAPGAFRLTKKEFDRLRILIHREIGINLGEEKLALAEGRLQKPLREQGFASCTHYLDHLESDTTGRAISELATRISTNHTFFCRERDHFDFFSRVVVDEAARRAAAGGERCLRVWSAGCSSGEEAYTLAILQRERFGAERANWDAGVLATDISEGVLAAARAGIYPEERVKLVPPIWRQRWFRMLPGRMWEVAPELKEDVTFRRLNLMNETFPFRRPFDVIFCRNVMIYFDEPTRRGLVSRFARWLVPGGYFFVGHSESLGRPDGDLDYVQPGIYRRRPR